MNIEDSNALGGFVDPAVISRLLTNYVAELQGYGVRDHLWLLFVLDDIVAYCEERGLSQTSRAIGSVLCRIDEEIVSSSINGSAFH